MCSELHRTACVDVFAEASFGCLRLFRKILRLYLGRRLLDASPSIFSPPPGKRPQFLEGTLLPGLKDFLAARNVHAIRF